jgi:hypothetical protein
MSKLKWIILALALIHLSCGVRTTTEFHKQYNIHVETNDTDMLDTIINLAAEFNRESGHDAIHIVEDSDVANSSIRFVDNLLQEKNYLGYGVGLTREVEGTSSLKGLTTIENKRVFLYAMHLQFDKANFKEHAKLALNANGDAQSWDHLYHLFCHEVGHGMLLKHDDSAKSNVMYPVIHKMQRDQIDYQSYFQSIDTFFEE